MGREVRLLVLPLVPFSARPSLPRSGGKRRDCSQSNGLASRRKSAQICETSDYQTLNFGERWTICVRIWARLKSTQVQASGPGPTKRKFICESVQGFHVRWRGWWSCEVLRSEADTSQLDDCTSVPFILGNIAARSQGTQGFMHLSICNLNIPPPLPGIPRAFDSLPFPGSREFDFRTAAGVGNVTRSRIF